MPDAFYPDQVCTGIFPDGRKVQINTMLVDNPLRTTPSFDNRYAELSTEADYIVYNGHAALGANVRAMTKKGKFRKGKYQILHMNGCDSFAYVDGSMAQARAILNPDDPAGTKYLDIITNGLPANPTWFPVGMMAILNSLDDIKKPSTYEQIFRQFESGQFAIVTGEEDNVFKLGDPILPAKKM